MNKRQFTVAALALAVALAATPARADVKKEERNQVSFARMLGIVVNFFGGKSAREGTVSTVAVSCDRKMTTKGDQTAQIVDLREEKIYDIDLRRKTYKVTTFEEMRQKIEKMRKDMPAKIKSGDGTFTINMGSYRRIGISTQTLTKQLADYFGVSEGILVTSVVENSAAAKAGLKAGDVITAVDGEKVDSPGDVTRAINKKEDGPVTLTVVRDRSSRSVTVTPEKPPAGSGADIRTITIPRIEIPTIPAITVTTPQIVVPTMPDINITVPRQPVRIVRPRVVII